MNYLELATKIAKSSKVAAQHKHFLFGCVALRRDGALVVSTNIRTCNRNSHSNHAEARVLRKAGNGSIIWLVRLDRSGNWAMAAPCNRCQALIKNKMVKRIFYTISPSEYGVWDPCKEFSL